LKDQRTVGGAVLFVPSVFMKAVMAALRLWR
jgi:hypothetical protein